MLIGCVVASKDIKKAIKTKIEETPGFSLFMAAKVIGVPPQSLERYINATNSVHQQIGIRYEHVIKLAKMVGIIIDVSEFEDMFKRIGTPKSDINITKYCNENNIPLPKAKIKVPKKLKSWESIMKSLFIAISVIPTILKQIFVTV